MERWIGRVALVTGASSGIGAAVAERLVKHGMKVVGCARRVDKIQAIAEKTKNEKGSLDALECDLSKEEDILSVFKFINQKHGGVDVCVNNGGVGLNAPLLEGETAMWKQVLDVNVLALMICTREAVKSMRDRGQDGHIIHIGSVAGHTSPSSPESNIYSVSKHTVRVITEGHRRELAELKSKIRVSAISPGYVETGFSIPMRGAEFVSKVYRDLECLQSTDVADAVDYVLGAPSHVQIHDIIIRPQQQKM